MRAVRLTFRILLAMVRLSLGVTGAVARGVTICLLWLVAPRTCFTFTMLRRR
jgi:hypothetical protein